jgi:hypothetical protein
MPLCVERQRYVTGLMPRFNRAPAGEIADMDLVDCQSNCNMHLLFWGPKGPRWVADDAF